MRLIASILCLYLFGLCVQPALFPLHTNKDKVMSCCKKDTGKSHKGCSGKGDGCCGDNQCNPFFSQCPICAANAVTVKGYLVAPNDLAFYTDPVFFSKDNNLIGKYNADILHPPQIV